MTGRAAANDVPAQMSAPPEWPSAIPFLPGRAATLRPMEKGVMVHWRLASQATADQRAELDRLREGARAFDFAAMGSLMQKIMGTMGSPMPESARVLVDELLDELDPALRAAGYVEEPWHAGMVQIPAMVMRRYVRDGVAMAVTASAAEGEVGVAVMVLP